MGNCCKTASSSTMEWGGEDWGSLVPKETKKIKNINRKKKKKSSSKVFDLISASSNSASLDDLGDGRIKIKMTKREFEVLLGEIEKQKQKLQGKVLSAEAVLVRLMTRENRHKPWSPVLESIPEV